MQGWKSDFNSFISTDSRKIIKKLDEIFPSSIQQQVAWEESIPDIQNEVGEVIGVKTNSQNFYCILEYELPFEISFLSQYFQYNINDYYSNGLPIDQNIDIPNLQFNIEELNPENLFIPGMGSPLAVLTEKSILFNLSKQFMDNQLRLNIGSLLDLTNKPNGIFDDEEEFVDINENVWQEAFEPGSIQRTHTLLISIEHTISF